MLFRQAEKTLAKHRKSTEASSAKPRIDHMAEIEKIWKKYGTKKEKSSTAAKYIEETVNHMQLPEDMKKGLIEFLLEYSKQIEYSLDRETSSYIAYT